MTNCKIWVTIRNYNNVHSDVVQTLFTSGNWSKNPQKIFSIWGEMSNVLKIYILILLTSKTCSVSCCKCVFKLAWLVDGCTGWCCVKSTVRGTPTIIYCFSPTNSLNSTLGHQLQSKIEWSPRYQLSEEILWKTWRATTQKTGTCPKDKTGPSQCKILEHWPPDSGEKRRWDSPHKVE